MIIFPPFKNVKLSRKPKIPNYNELTASNIGIQNLKENGNFETLEKPFEKPNPIKTAMSSVDG
jgi:hypothetical protein